MVAQAQSKKDKPKNDPKKVDSMIGWIILMGFGCVVGFVLVQNIAPYSTLFTGLMQQVPLLGWIPGIPSFLGLIVGVMCLAAVQSAEIWPQLMLDTPAEYRDEEWKRRVSTACVVATFGYAFDVAACASFWPALKVPFTTFRYAPTWGAVDWLNIAIAATTLFGLAAYVWLWRYIRKVM
ncbi:MAG: hypothetical protein AAF609_18560 [Cyanobacteria bacterium P01_C01_bin.120]